MVGLVVDPQFGDRLEALVAQMHVWVVESPGNLGAATRIGAAGSHGLEAGGVTTFGKGWAGEREQVCLSVLETIDLHHFYHQPAYSVLEVVGVAASSSLQEKLREFGFTTFTGTPEGFRASK